MSKSSYYKKYLAASRRPLTFSQGTYYFLLLAAIISPNIFGNIIFFMFAFLILVTGGFGIDEQ